MNNEKTAAGEAGQIIEDAQGLLSATANIAEGQVVAARNRLMAALQGGREIFSRVQDKAIAGAKVTDETIREYPYHSLGVALGVGVLVGYILGRRS